MVRATVSSSVKNRCPEIVKTSTIFKSGCLSFTFRLVGAEHNLRHYIAQAPILQMSKWSPRAGKFLVTQLLIAEPGLECRPPISSLGLVLLKALLLFNSMD